MGDVRANHAAVGGLVLFGAELVHGIRPAEGAVDQSSNIDETTVAQAARGCAELLPLSLLHVGVRFGFPGSVAKRMSTNSRRIVEPSSLSICAGTHLFGTEIPRRATS